MKEWKEFTPEEKTKLENWIKTSFNINYVAKFDDQSVKINDQKKENFPTIWPEEHRFNEASEIDLSFWCGVCLERKEGDSPFQSSEDVWNQIIQVHLEEIIGE